MVRILTQMTLSHRIRPDGHQVRSFRSAYNLTGAAGHGSSAQRVPDSAVRILLGATNGNTPETFVSGVADLCAEIELVRQLCIV